MDITMGRLWNGTILRSNDLLNFYHIISSQSFTVCRDPVNDYELCTSARGLDISDSFLGNLKSITRLQVAIHRVQIHTLVLHITSIVFHVDPILTDIHRNKSIGRYLSIRNRKLQLGRISTYRSGYLRQGTKHTVPVHFHYYNLQLADTLLPRSIYNSYC